MEPLTSPPDQRETSYRRFMSGQAVDQRLEVEFSDDLITPLLQVHH